MSLLSENRSKIYDTVRLGGGAAELVWIAQPRRLRVVGRREAQSRFLKRQLSLPVSTMSQ